MKDLTPQQIVCELDRYIIGQADAKRVVAIALRNRFRRLALAPEMQAEITPKNILMIGPTGVGKTEIARRLAKLADAPFLKVEATKFTQVGYVGRDVESIIRDLMDVAVGMVHDKREAEVRDQAANLAEERIVDIIARRDYYAQQPQKKERGVSNGAGGVAGGVGARATLQPSTVSASGGHAAGSKASPARMKSQKQLKKIVAEQLAKHEREEEIIEIELEPEENFSSVFEFVSGVASDDVSDGFQDFLNAMPGGRRRSRRVSVKEARRLLTQEEANKLIDVEQVVEHATQLVEQSGIVFLDELDKVVGSKVDVGPDVSGEGVQRDLLPIVEGSTVMTRYGPAKTDHILWIAAGAFHNAKPADLIPEMQGRLPLRVELAPLTQADFKRILTQPENALTRQYQALLAVEGVTLEFTDDGLDELARSAFLMNERVENIGARRLQTIVEKVLEDVSFNAPNMQGQAVTIDAAFVRARLERLLKDEDLSKYIL